MRIKTDYRFGKETETEWAGVYGYNPDDPAIFEELGEMFSVVRMESGVKDLDLEKIAKIMISELQDHYFSKENEQKSLLEKLEKACWKMKSKMDFLLSREPEVLEKGLDLEMAIVVIKEKFMYCLVIGESQIYVLRDGNLAEISKALIDKTSSGLFRSGSLEIKDQDKIALATGKVVGDKAEELHESLENLNLADIEETSTKSGASLMFIADETAYWNKFPKKEEKVEEIAEESGSKTEGALETDDKEIDHAEPDVKDLEEGELSSSATEEDLSEDEFDEDEDIDDEVEKVGIMSKLANLTGKLKRKPKEESEDEQEDEDSEEDVDNEDDYEGAWQRNENKKGMIGGVIGKGKSFGNKISGHFENNQTTYTQVIRKLIGGIKNLGKNLKLLFVKEVLGKSPNRRMVNKQRLKRNRLIFAVLIIVFAGFLFINLRNLGNSKKEKARAAKDESSVAAFETNFDDIAAQIDSSSASSLETRSALITSLDDLDKQVNDYKSESKLIDRLNAIKLSIRTKEDFLLLKTTFTEPKVVTDVAVQVPDALLSDIAFSNGSLFISDSAKGVVYKVATDLGSKPEEQVSGLKEPYLLVKDVNNDIIFFDKNDTLSVGKFKTNTKDSVKRFEGLTRSVVGNLDNVAIYMGNNALYELHDSNKQIFKRVELGGGTYSGGGATYEAANPPNWRTDESFSKAVDIAAPYEIYVLVQDAGIKRFLAGGDNTIKRSTYVNLLDSDFDSIKTATAIDVSAGYLAVADPTNKRVLLFKVQNNTDKKLQFIKQFQYSGDLDIFSNIKELVINEPAKQIYVLDGTRVIRLDF